QRPHVRRHRPPHRLRHPRVMTPLLRRRLHNFRANRRGFWSLWIFLILFGVSLFSELIAHDHPLLVRYDGRFYFPLLRASPEATSGGGFPPEPVYRDPAVIKLIREKGWMVWPPIPSRYDPINYELPVPPPAPPSRVNWLGTDDQGRDILARLIYGFRISVLFGLTLTVLSSVVGVASGLGSGRFRRAASPPPPPSSGRRILPATASLSSLPL